MIGPAMRYIALLRGVNLGKTARVSMPKLRELLTGLGYEGVGTYVASGNVVLTSRHKPARLERELRAQIAEGMGIDVPVLVRTRDQLAKVVALDPLGSYADDPARYMVSFLSAKPKASVLRELAPLDVEPGRFVVHGRELYAWHPEGVGRSKLGALLSEKRLGVVATARNWNTVTKLLELASERG
jgi:uncharacterized protein (DUF1697 family)